MTDTASLGVASPVTDAPQHGIYHFLDVGGLKYGECTLVEFGAIRILIDGSHSKDFEGQDGYRSIPEQLQDILGEPPYDIAMIVVTHGHADHVGCLPELVSKGVIKPRFALLTDLKLGFGRTQADDASALDAANPRVRLAALLREEDASDLDDRELAEFIDAVATVEQRYAGFVRDLVARGTEVIRYRGQALPERLAQLLAPTGATLLGPTEEQLLFCAEQISTTNKEAEDAVDGTGADSDGDLIGLYRSIARADADAQRNPRGNGMNCQSITFAFGPPKARVLLAGDMQFSEPGVRGADEEVRKLRERVAQAGPYKLFKTTHHTSHNGQDDDFLAAIGDPELIVHSGGLNDSSHPFPDVLKMLKGRDGIRFARTDRNGVITVRPHLPADRAIEVTKGRLNNFTPNRTRDEMGEVPPSATPQREFQPPVPASGVQIVIVNLPNAPVDLIVSGVDIRIRGQGERLVIRSGGGDPQPVRGPEIISPRLPPAPPIGRSLERLLFVTDRERLRRNIGREEADAALASIEKAGGILQVSDGEAALDKTRQVLTGSTDVKGVVLLGGYDVIPSARTDAIGAELRGLLGDRVNADGDHFWVWSDKLYGDKNGDAVAEFAVSRVPDAHDAQLFRAAITAQPLRLGERFGVRNVVRPFADSTWTPGVGRRALNVSQDFLSSHVVPTDLQSSCHYFMLHGAEKDGRAFSGEYLNGGYPVAFTTENVPAAFNGIVFTGCCWGALIVDGKASLAGDATPPHRTPQTSIALSYLKAGAVAFIGCTGSHYSGADPDPNLNLAALLHREFWSNIAQPAAAPAAALHRAKEAYLRWIVDQGTRLDPLATARRLKNFSQFTCLGLGW